MSKNKPGVIRNIEMMRKINFFKKADMIRMFLREKTKNTYVNGICFQANDNIARDEMKALEENASVAAAADAPSSETSKKENVDRNIMFVRGETQSKSVVEAQRTQVSSPLMPHCT